MNARRVYWVGCGLTPRWQDVGNWSAESGGRPGYPPPGVGAEAVFDERSGSGEADLFGCPAALSISGFRGTLVMPRGGRVALGGQRRSWWRRRRDVVPRVARAVSERMPWTAAVREGLASLVGSGRELFVVPRASGAVTTFFAVPVAGSGTFTWDGTTDSLHWATTSGGTGGLSGSPTSADSVTFDSNSGTSATVTFATGGAAASITISKSDLTLTHSAGSTVSGAVTLTAGTLNTNGQTCSWGSLLANGGSTKTLTITNSTITITGSTQNPGWTTNSSTTTVNATGSTITFTGSYGSAGAGFSGHSSQTYATLDIRGQAITFPGSIGTLTMRGDPTSKTHQMNANNNGVVSGTVTLIGGSVQSVNRLLLASNTVGAQRTITAAAYVINGDVDFMDINLAYSGGASWTNTGSAFIGDALGNSGAVTTNRTTPATQDWQTTTSGSWSDATKWTSRVPLPQDNVTVNRGFSASQTITADMPRLCADLVCTGTTGNPTISNGAVTTGVYGSLTFVSGMNWTNSSTFALRGRSTHTVTWAGVGFGFTFQMRGPGGTYTQQDAYSGSGSFTLAEGTWVTNGFSTSWGSINFSTGLAGTWDATGGTSNITAGSIGDSFTGPVTVKLGSGTWTITGTGSVWTTTSAATTIVPGTAIIDLTSTSGTARTFAGGGKSFPTLRFRSTGAGGLTITGNNTYTNLDLECTTARTITLPASGTQTVTGNLTLLGAVGQSLSLVSSSPGTATTINAGPAATEFAFGNYTASADVTILKIVCGVVAMGG